jgi:hypothetical protein
VAVGAPVGEADGSEGETGQGRHHQGLVEDDLRVPVVLAPDGLGDERRGAHAQGLGEREDQEHEVPGQAHARDRLLAQPAHEVEVGEEVQGLEGRAQRDEGRELEHVLADRTPGQVVHGAIVPGAGAADRSQGQL